MYHCKNVVLSPGNELFSMLTKSPLPLFGIPGDKFMIKINRPPPVGDSMNQRCQSPRELNIKVKSIPVVFRSALLRFVCNEQMSSAHPLLLLVVRCLLFVVSVYYPTSLVIEREVIGGREATYTRVCGGRVENIDFWEKPPGRFLRGGFFFCLTRSPLRLCSPRGQFHCQTKPQGALTEDIPFFH